MYDILNNFEDLSQLKKMSFNQLNDFSEELRNFLIEKVSKTGGHLASNLGVVELTLSLYSVFDLDKDKIIWDVGHQTYVHKILTGRKDKFDNLRRHGGISGFPKCCESKYDLFETGHSSTSISAALGMARARDLTDENYQVVAVIGDGALTGGMALEALNDVGYRKTNLIIILNDNQMSIGKNVGGLSTYLSKIRIDPKYNKFKLEFNEALRKTNLGNGLADSLKRIKSGIKQILVPGMFFEDMGIKYLGPIDGHNIKEMTRVMSMAKEIKGPVLIHAITKKGKGYIFAENNPDKFHGVSSFDWMTGQTAKSTIESYSQAFGEAMVKIASNNDKVVAITAAMKDGTGLTEFAQKFPKRFFDVGIAEQHAVTLAAGMAKGGLKPVFAVYSTFLQRAYDQVIHDVCQQKLPVVIAVDRAGIVGDDGETHQGVFDLSYLSHMPNITIMSPKSTEELKFMLEWAINQKCPVAIRYPRGGDKANVYLAPLEVFNQGKWEVINKGGKTAIIATGKMVQIAAEAQVKLKNLGVETTLINACFIKPIDKSLLKSLVEQNYNIITIEDNVMHGGLGSLVLEYANLLNHNANVTNLGFEDKFIPHGNVEILYKLNCLDVDGLVGKIIKIV